MADTVLRSPLESSGSPMLYRAFRPANGSRSLIDMISRSQTGCSVVAPWSNPRVSMRFHFRKDL
jgi:hypothetical protein